MLNVQICRNVKCTNLPKLKTYFQLIENEFAQMLNVRFEMLIENEFAQMLNVRIEMFN